MGSCVSLHKDPDSALKLRLDFGSKTDKLVNPSPYKHNHPIPIPMAADAVIKPHWSPPAPALTDSRNFGSKEETFFDSHPWLESDCEDDFFSVNGDFTPSRGNTPVHDSIPVTVRTPAANRQLIADKALKTDSRPEPSPTDQKKKLSELFKDSIGSERYEKEDVGGNDWKGSENTTTPNVSDLNSGSRERTPKGDVGKSVRSAQCCLPRLRSFSERKKRASPSPIRSVV